uniref:histone acetyltransferase n=1 Tax=Araucaria cunninghamii TaxID=56994 RepID=A0A0D6R4V5_ARACU
MPPVKKIEPEKEKKLEDNKPKRRRVAFATDPGIEANECISLHLVSNPEEMQDAKGSEDEGLSFHPEYMEQFVGEDGKIYGYRGLKINVWVNALSFHAFVDIKYESKFEDGRSEKKNKRLERSYEDNIWSGFDGRSRCFSSKPFE